jgi:hypothetical protein
VRSYAKHRRRFGMVGGTHRSVQKALAAGRVAKAVTKDGRGRVVINFAVADREWASNTMATKSRNCGMPTLPPLDHVASPVPELESRRTDEFSVAIHRGRVFLTVLGDEEHEVHTYLPLSPVTAYTLGMALLDAAKHADQSPEYSHFEQAQAELDAEGPAAS